MGFLLLESAAAPGTGTAGGSSPGSGGLTGSFSHPGEGAVKEKIPLDSQLEAAVADIGMGPMLGTDGF